MANRKYRKRCDYHLSRDRRWDQYKYAYSFDNVDYYICILCCERREELIQKAEVRRLREEAERDARHQKFLDEIDERHRRAERELWDHVVRRDLLRGVKNAGLIEVPKETIRLHRSIMRLNRLIKDKKEESAEAIKKEKLAQVPVEPIKSLLKKCHIHGKLQLSDMIKSGFNRHGEQYYKCKLCSKRYRDFHYENNKDVINEKCKTYRANNVEKVREFKRKYYQEKKHGKDSEHATTAGNSLKSV